MAATSYRFLPWARRGLAAHAGEQDEHGPLPARAALTVGLTVSSIPEARKDLALFGPGDVIGLDPKLIVSTSPRSNSTDVEPNYFAQIEFDPPDLPWLFTPAQAPTDERLRPWCVLVVIDLDVLDAPRTHQGQPLPVLDVPREAVGSELPDLAESWAWAHAQVVAPAGVGDVAAALSGDPNLTVSRIVSPRRLEPGKRYAACLVPAFDAGVTRGLGDVPDAARALGPAWTAASADLRLPVYFHWEFATGPEGDFESLARRLQPFRAAGDVGVEAMDLSDAGFGLAAPAQPLLMDGALRAPRRATPSLEDVPEDLRIALKALLNAAEDQAMGGGDAPALGPPLYGAFHAARHRLADGEPAWLHELNLDPRARAAAGLGAEIERANQEVLMQWCWEQVGRILEANRLLSRARLSIEVLARVHERHVKPLPPGTLLGFAGPLLPRTPVAGATVTSLVARSSLPDAAADPALRRLTSPRRAALRAAMSRTAALRGAPSSTAAPAASAPTQLVTGLADGRLDVDPTRFVPDGVADARALAAVEVPSAGDEPVDLQAAGIAGSAPASLLRDLRAEAAEAAGGPPPVIRARPDLSSVGIVMSGPFEASAGVVGRGRELPGDPSDPGDPPTRPRRVHDQLVIRRLQRSLARAAPGGVLGTPAPVRSLVPFDVGGTAAALRARTDPRTTVPRRLTTMLVTGNGGGLLDDPPDRLRVTAAQDRVMAAPELDVSVADLLARLDRTRFLPGVGSIPDEALTLLETNPRFVAALLAGLNTEMNRELLWREFPTDQRGTPFRRFWKWADGAPDIAPMTAWHAELAHNARGGPGGQIALLVRGRLLRRYPNTVVYAWRSNANGELTDPPGAGDLELPVFAGVLGDDMAFYGFNLADTQLVDGAGWFFVLQEQPTQPRFGFDEAPRGTAAPSPPPPPGSWSEATWEHTGTAPGAYLRISENPLEDTVLSDIRFADHAGALAAITLQKPFRVAVHARSLVEAGDPDA